jgi:RHS repeat-associated protein
MLDRLRTHLRGLTPAARRRSLGAIGAGALALVLGTPLGIHTAFGTGVGGLAKHASSAPLSDGDSVVVFGPRTFRGVDFGTHVFVETFAATPGANYTLRAENLTTVTVLSFDSTGTIHDSTYAVPIDSGVVVLNGTQVFGPADFGAGAVGEHTVTLQETNTLQVTIRSHLSSGGALIRVTTLGGPDPTYTIHGPTQVAVLSGSSRTLADSFPLPADAKAPYRMYVQNGNPDGTNRVAGGSITLNGATVVSSTELTAGVASIQRDVTLLSQNHVTYHITGSSVGKFYTVRFVATDSAPPVLTVSAPAPGAIVASAHVAVSGQVQDQTSTTVTVNGMPATMGLHGAFSATVGLPSDGPNAIQISAVDAAGNHTDSTIVVARDTQAPELVVSVPADASYTNQGAVTVSGTVSDLTAVTVNVNGTPLTVDAGAFSGTVALNEGSNVLAITATDAAGNVSSVARTVVRDTAAPALTIATPTDGLTTSDSTVSVSGTVSDASPVTVTIDGATASVSGGAFSRTIALASGANTIAVVAADAAGNTATITRTVTRTSSSGGGELAETLPVDSSIGAPALDRTAAAPVALATQFLYTGVNAVQQGVAPGTILPARAAVVRGRVVSAGGNPISGVTITLAGHPELGSTTTRANGEFDLAVNGGGLARIVYAKSGYLSAQRQVDVPLQDYAIVDDVVLTPLDTQVTTIDFAAPIEVARGSAVSDADGARQATLFFSQGTQASMVLPDSTTQPLASIAVRATEYTVGPSGLAAMPAPLPPSTAYTYAVELSADEAIAAGATDVRFTKAVALYVDNFLRFPVGYVVPAGYYDRARGTWVPSDNGRVVKIAAVTGGRADLVVDTTGTVADSATLAALGISDAERQELATLYAPGTTLWRAQVTHFTPWDLNPPYRRNPRPPYPPRPPFTPHKDPKKKPCSTTGSVIDCEAQVLGERLGISGTGLTLNYRSNRVPGYVAGSTLRIPITDADTTGFGAMKRIELTIEIAGRRFSRTFDPRPNQSFAFTWDGRDAYGRPVQGQQNATITLDYVYALSYYMTADNAAAFGLPCEAGREARGGIRCVVPDSVVAALGGTPRQEITDRVTQSATIDPTTDQRLGVWAAVVQKLGGWTISAHHVYDPIGQVLYFGDGTQRSTEVSSGTITRVAGSRCGASGGATLLSLAAAGGNDCPPENLDGGPADSAYVDPAGIAIALDGSIYIADEKHCAVRRVTTDGRIAIVAGAGSPDTTTNACGSDGDGGPARQAHLAPAGIALGPDGSVYVADNENDVIRRITPDGTITTALGTPGVCGSSGDGGPADSALVCGLISIAAGPDGSVYFAGAEDGGSALRVRRIGPDGIVSTVAGTGDGCTYLIDPNNPTFDRLCGDGGSAIAATFSGIRALAVGPDGSLYIADAGNSAIRRVFPDGTIARVAGTGGVDYVFKFDQGIPATKAELNFPTGLAVGPDGTLYFAEPGNAAVRHVGLNGIINVSAGVIYFGDCNPFADSTCGDGGPALRAALSEPYTVAVGPDGSLYIADRGSNTVRKVDVWQPHFSGNIVRIASEDGGAIYEFSSTGRHLRTIDAATGLLRYAFSYDSAGLLTGITDRYGNTVTVERRADGEATAIVAPFGQRTTLATDSSGYLVAVTNPAGEQVALTYGAGGRLATLTDPRGGTHEFTYDPAGHLIKDMAPDSSAKLLGAAEDPDGVSVSITTALGRGSSYQTDVLPTGDLRQTVTSSTGQTTTAVVGVNGTDSTMTPDSTVTRVVRSADPRFGQQAPLAREVDIATPSGLWARMTMSRSVVMAGSGDTARLAMQTDSVVVNDRAFTSTFDATARTTTTTSPEGRQAVTTFDSLGRVAQRQVPGMLPITYTYDDRGRVTETVQGVRHWHYDYGSDGRVATITDPLGHETHYFYDAAGRVTRKQLADGREILTAYDSAGNLTSITPPGRPAHRLTYTSNNLPQSYVMPVVGSDTATLTYTYNRDHDLSLITRPDATAIQFNYNTAGQATGITAPNGQYQFTYSPTTGLPASITTPTGNTLSYTYDGLLATASTWSGEVQGTVAFTYNQDFRVADVLVNGTSVGTTDYDADGYLISAGSLSVTHNPDNGLLSSTSIGSVTTDWTYDGYGADSMYVAKFRDSTLYSAAYTRDSLGRISQLIETVAGVATTYAYAYDSTGRLIEVRRNGTAISSYGYDSNDNRTSRTTPNGTLVGSYDAQDRLISYGSAAYTFGLNGDLALKVVGSDTTRYVYDAFGNLLQARLPSGEQIDYVVDGKNRRIGKKVNGVLVQGFLYSGKLSPVAELDGNNQVVSRFVYGTRVNVPDYMIKGGTTYRLITDHRGSVRLVVDVATGQVVQQLDYDESGQVVQNTNPGFQPFGFAGGLYDAETGLVRFGVRDYDAETGRWTNKDPSGFSGGATNLYRYANADPVNFVDATGNFPFLAILAAMGEGALVGGITDILTQLASNGGYWACIDWRRVATAAAIGAITDGTLAALKAWKFVEALADILRGGREVEAEGKAFVGEAGASPSINPHDVAGKTPAEIDAFAKENGLIPKGPDPMNGRGAYIDPVTGEQRILSHPNADPPHMHVNDASGARLDINGNIVSPESPDAHLPIGGP